MTLDSRPILNAVFKDFNLKASLKEQSYKFESIPHYPSISSFSNILFENKINNQAVKLSHFNEIYEIEGSFIALLNSENIGFAYIKEVLNNSVYLINEFGQTKNIEIEKFKNLFTGYLIILDHSKKQTEPAPFSTRLKNYYSLNEKEFTLSPILIIGFSFLIINSFLIQEFNLLIHSITSFIGLVISIIIFLIQINSSSNLKKRFCIVQEKNSCTNVLESKFSKVLGKFSLSELGMVYFLSYLIIIYLSSEDIIEIDAIYFLTIYAAFFIPFSLYVQFIKLKSVCTLCLTIALILTINLFFVDIPASINNSVLSSHLIQLIIFFIILMYLYNLSKLIRSNQKNYLLEIRQEKILRNHLVKQSLLKGNKKINTEGNLSDNNYLNVIKIIVTLDCQHCAKLLSENRNIIQSLILDKQNGISITPVILENSDYSLGFLNDYYLEYRKNKLQAFQNLITWYGLKKKENYNKGTTVEQLSNNSKEFIIDNQNFISKNKILRFPFISVNGYELPEEYNLTQFLNDDFLEIDHLNSNKEMNKNKLELDFLL